MGAWPIFDMAHERDGVRGLFLRPAVFQNETSEFASRAKNGTMIVVVCQCSGNVEARHG